jgi:hypothetical protein
MRFRVIDYHRELLADETRTNAYRDAILRVVRPGDVVVDLGCGSGILSFFACQAGASHVYAIDSTRAADIAAFLAKRLGFGDRVTVLRKESHEVELPQLANVLVTETMGVLGFDEHIAGHVLDARKRLLTPDARIVPARVSTWLVPVELDHHYEQHINFWSEPHYGFDLSKLRMFASNSSFFAHIHTRAHLAEPAELLALDLNSGLTEASGRAEMVMKRDAVVHGFGAFFEARLADGITLTNRDARTTSWSQSFFPLETAIHAARGTRVDVSLEMDDGKSWRWRGNIAGQEFDQTTWLALPPAGL